jgi:hypothetical protein
MVKVDVTIGQHLNSIFAFSPRDWSENREDAWLYGIVCGWNDECMAELKDKFRWSDDAVEALKFRRKQFLEVAGCDS